jgi:hypothetical protein
MTMTDPRPLGPFQDFWEAWNDSHKMMLRKDIAHFRAAFEVQFEELENHAVASDIDAAANEAADVISIGLNLMRWLGYSPQEVAEIARNRAKNRMSGQTAEILDKYS